MEDDLLKYFMEETNKKLDQVEEKLADLTKFKIEMIATARMTSFLVSGICGLITMLVTVAITWKWH